MTKTIVILHGWGKSGKDYKGIQTIFEKNGYTVFSPDMPGFGNMQLTRTMTLDDYVEFVCEYLAEHKIKKTIFIGHSFGGRVAAKLTVQHPEVVEKLILTGAPLIKQPLSVKKQIVAAVVKPARKIADGLPLSIQHFLTKSVYRAIGEWDYYKAGPLKETFKNIIQEDLKEYLSKITVPTHIVWGEKDTFVPLSVGRQIAQSIPSATLHSISGASHKLPYENPTFFAAEVLTFLK